MFPLNFGVRSLKMVTMPKHVGLKELKYIEFTFVHLLVLRRL